MSTRFSRHSSALLEAQKESLELVVSGAPLPTVLDRLARTVEEQSPGRVVASIMLLDGDRRLRNAAAPSLPADYLAQIDGLPADASVGTCCAAAARAEVVITPDFATSAGWQGIAHLPLALGLCGAWSMPIQAHDGRVLGTFGTYFRERRGPTRAERAVVEVLARTAAIAIERDQADAESARQAAELRAAKNAAEAAAERAVEANQVKSQFLAVMSHELRTPLSGIIGHADLLASGFTGALSAEQVDHAQRIKAGAWHLVSLIDEILSFSRLEAGKTTVERSRVDVAQLVREAVQLLEPYAASRGLTILARTPATPLVLMTDAGKVRQVVLNLLGNAIKFSEHGAIELTVAPHGDARVVVRVRDNGCGIPAEKTEFVFEAFAQADQSHARRANGTGLGLTVSRRLARLLGGDVRLEESTVGQGSCFALDLPHIAADAEQPNESAPQPGLRLESSDAARIGIA